MLLHVGAEFSHSLFSNVRLKQEFSLFINQNRITLVAAEGRIIELVNLESRMPWCTGTKILNKDARIHKNNATVKNQIVIEEIHR